jgi:hypothetical protein
VGQIDLEKTELECNVRTMWQERFENVNNCLNAKIALYLVTCVGKKSYLHLIVFSHQQSLS